ncbi:MAG: 2-hydroxyacyl-CoA dehydratase family protein [Hydrogenoanaerobacterium sp.]
MEYNVPLITLDYPGEQAHDEFSYDYVLSQHKLLITEMEKLSGNTLNLDRLTTLINYSKNSVLAWQNVVDLLSKYEIPPTLLFDNMSMLITSRCKPETSEFYRLLALEIEKLPSINTSRPQLFWLGYPLWYHAKRYLADVLQDVRICGSNYITWWNLDYSGKDPFEQLYNAYNFTFLNLTQKTKSEKLAACITKSGATGAIVLRNKSCKCDFVSARNVGLPQAEIEIDMIDREFLDISQAKRQIESLLESL